MADSFFENEVDETPSRSIPNLDDNAVEPKARPEATQEGFEPRRDGWRRFCPTFRFCALYPW